VTLHSVQVGRECRARSRHSQAAGVAADACETAAAADNQHRHDQECEIEIEILDSRDAEEMRKRHAGDAGKKSGDDERDQAMTLTPVARAVRGEPTVTVECLSCRHVGVLTGASLSRLAIMPDTPIATFVKRLRCSKCGSRSVLATRKPPARPQWSS
jgi:hypothetical protein